MLKPNLKLSEIEPIPIKHDGNLQIAVGKSRFDTKWKNQNWTWGQLLARLSSSILTAETHAEYLKMPKDRQDQVKDVGGFVGGQLREGHRKSENVISRQLLTLDLDFAPGSFPQDMADNLDLICAYCIYSTHKYAPTMPKYRLVIPLNREVSADEYEAIARKVAEKVGIDFFDDSTYQPSRLMYWPSHSSDVTPVFEYADETWLDADAILREYPDWTDVSYWPESSRMTGIRKKQADKQGDPTEKTGIVGYFCRTYTVPEAIAKFLPDVYTPTSKEDRYTYSAGSTAAGLVIYNDGKFAYSNHGTDPAGGQLCNAFDLVRIHKFAELDEGSNATGTSRPSYEAMASLVAGDPESMATKAQEDREKAAEDFAEVPPETDWRNRLTRKNKTGEVDPTAVNAELILTFEEQLQGIRYNELARQIEATNLPWPRPGTAWRDADDAQLYQWIAKVYHVQFPDNRFRGALMVVADNRRFHPVREYLEGLPEWDGVKRVDTLLVDYLGAEDTAYTREATRKCLLAAVTRIFRPGAKFDNVLVLQGPQGIGKSTIFARLAGEWFSDALSISDMRDKTAAERLQGYWIVEISEMTGMRKMEVETIKSFITRQDDIYRAAYGRNLESHKRQCIIVGSTNEEDGFLRDTTGNRRFWPIPVTGDTIETPWDLTPEIVDQIWAETMANYRKHESLLLSREATQEAIEAQREAMEADERQGLVEAYLDRLLPENWEELDEDQRLLFLQSDDIGTVKRSIVSCIEIWVECLGKRKEDMDRQRDAKAIMMIMTRIKGWKRSGRKRLKLYGQQKVYIRED